MTYLLPHIIDEAAARTPDAEAFRFANTSISYATLSTCTNSLAYVLAEAGVRRGDRVGVYLSKGLFVPVALYGIMKAGAAYVPLDPRLPSTRLTTVLQDAGIRQLVTQDSFCGNIREAIAAGAVLHSLIGPTPQNDLPPAITWQEVKQAPGAAWPQEGLTEQDMAYLMYTSGSTGTPKGIIHTHASGLSYARLAADVYGLRSTDRLSGFPPLHFDQSTFDYFSGPIAGATTVIISEMHMMMPASLSNLIEAERLTIWYSVPYALIQLLLRGALEQRDHSSLRWVLFGGEVFPVKHLRALMQQWPHARFSNVYGPAEVNQCTYYHVPPLGVDDEPLPIGPTWPNAEGVVLDEDDAVLPPGKIGELAVHTPTMMCGYWNRPDLNARAFFYRTRDGGMQEVFYRTGDLVRLNSDGHYEFLGRKDRQVKARGFRVELDEVEAALLTHPDVAEAAVIPTPDADGTVQIRALVRCHTGGIPAAASLRAHAATLLPPYALPTDINFVDDFPRTTSGKIDRRTLQEQVSTATLL